MFLHVDKVAGSAMHDIMYSNFLPYGGQMHCAGMASGFDCRYVVKNSSSNRRGGNSAEKKAFLDQFGDRIKENNAEDIVLYEYAVAAWGSAKAVSFRMGRSTLKSALQIATGKALHRWWFVPHEKKGWLP